MEFEWEPKKAIVNTRKHDLMFQEAASVFGDALAITFKDQDHSMNEKSMDHFWNVSPEEITRCLLYGTWRPNKDHKRASDGPQGEENL